MQQRPLFVSNRLSARVREQGDAVDVQLTAGGLATALRDVQETTDARWLGWPGRVAPQHRDVVTLRLAEAGAIPVFLDEGEVAAYYEGYANGVLWPLLHSNLDRLPFDADADWPAFRAVNQRFATACIDAARAGDPIWVHDFHLALVPGEIRRRVPDARVGFFLHVPFPALQVFRVLPRAHEIITGLLGADVVGFHTATFAEAFVDAARSVGARVDGDRVEFAGHVSRVGVFPIGVDVQKIEACAHDDVVRERVAGLKSEARGRTILLGVDRLDYTKGLPRRILAIERLLERWPELAPRLHFVQLAVPTRENTDGYGNFRDVVNRLVGRVNGRFGTATGVPIHFMYREVALPELVALYAAADVMIVTPLRDGMNLVCKEYVAAHVDERGSLVLSELAGAADELEGALLVNPYDIDEVARRLREAILMSDDEQRVRMGMMRRQVRAHDVHRWAARFLGALANAGTMAGATRERCDGSDSLVRDNLGGSAVADTLAGGIARAVDADHLHLVLDYDGTLVPIAATPSEAEPDPALLALLESLAAAPATSVCIASGRDRATLEQWLGALPITLTAEHGAHVRVVGGTWSEAPIPSWKARAVELMRRLADGSTGSFVEVKHCSVALHTRGIPPVQRAALEAQAGDLLRAIDDEAEVLFGNCIVEVRMRGQHKGRFIEQLSLGENAVIVAGGDDTTDDDLFAALPDGSVAVAVGPRCVGARFRVDNPGELRVLLSRVAGARASRAAAARTPTALIDPDGSRAAGGGGGTPTMTP